jgi:SAM-dependent methyltransferase
VTETQLVRAASPRALWGAEGVYLFGPQEEVCALEGEHADLVGAVLEEAAAPIEREVLVARILEEAGADASQRGAVDQAIELLLRLGALVMAKPSPPEASVGAGSGAAMHARAHVLVCVTGAIGSLSAPSLVLRLIASGCDVRVAMTRASRRFVTARGFEAITHRHVATSMWSSTPEAPAPHIELARWADVVVVYPTTATTLSRLVSGDCSELVSAVATTTRAPVLLTPSMNLEMIVAPAVEENLAKLRERGFFVAHPGMGIEVADAPAERVKRGGVAPPPAHVVRYVHCLLDRALAGGPKLLSRAEWEAEHERLELDDSHDADLAAALEAHAPPGARVLDVGTGLGAMARAAARRGCTVVATDYARRAIERARAVDPAAGVTWVVDDATDTSLVGSFDLVLDRACLGCIPVSRRERYLTGVGALLRLGGVLALKVHAAPARPIRAHAFTKDEIVALAAPWFTLVAARETTLDFGALQGSPALFIELRRSADAR